MPSWCLPPPTVHPDSDRTIREALVADALGREETEEVRELGRFEPLDRLVGRSRPGAIVSAGDVRDGLVRVAAEAEEAPPDVVGVETEN